MMKRIKRYIAAAVLAVMMTAGLSSCIYDNISEGSASNQTEDDNITLFIRLGILDGPASRAEARDVECMSSIRIVMLDLDNGGKVEYNERIDYGNNPVISTGFILIPTIKGEKKIFFIANEDSVTLGKKSKKAEDGEDGENGESGDDDESGEDGESDEGGESLTSLIESFEKGAEGFEDAINGVYFELDPNLPLPMTSEYRLTAGRPGDNNYTFYVVPAATKYTFNITNKRAETSSTITRIAIENLADVNYVMPHVGQQYRNWANADGTMSSLYWIDWLKNVVDATNSSQKVPGNTEVNQRLGWILDYELPEHEDGPHDMFVGNEAIPGVPDNMETANPEYTTVTFGPYYAPESKSLKSEAAPNGAQTYALVLELTDGESQAKEFSRELTYVTALFRNTHVVVDIIIEMGYMHIYGEIRKWNDNKVYGALTEED